jgi:hypothetical protein
MHGSNIKSVPDLLRSAQYRDFDTVGCYSQCPVEGSGANDSYWHLPRPSHLADLVVWLQRAQRARHKGGSARRQDPAGRFQSGPHTHQAEPSQQKSEKDRGHRDKRQHGPLRYVGESATLSDTLEFLLI